jgi:TldD protein
MQPAQRTSLTHTNCYTACLMKDLAQYAIDTAVGLGASYADVRIIDQKYESIATKNLSIAAFNRATSCGIGIRVLAKGGWGFSSTQHINKRGIREAAKLAVATALASASCLEKPYSLAPEPIQDAVWVSPHRIDPFSVSTEDKLAVLLESAKLMLAVRGVTLAQGELTFIHERKYFASSEGSSINQTFIRSGCGIQATATDDSDQQRRCWPQFLGQHELAGWEMVEKWDLPGNAQRIAEEVVALLKAPQCPQERSTVILGASQVGLQIHESCGHPSELDRALGWEVNFSGLSFLTPDKLGHLRYGSPIVNLVADATAPGALGSFGFDDEGVAAQCVNLVTNGIFTGYLSSRDTAGLIGLKRSGGAMRAESWAFVPIIRMTNISLLPSHSGSLEDIISDTKNGIYMETNKSWSIDGRRNNFQFSTEIGYEIKNGKLGRLLKNPSYSGITPEFWNSCDAIGGPENYVAWGLPNCGKGQPCQVMWTGHGAAPARFRDVQVGIAQARF